MIALPTLAWKFSFRSAGVFVWCSEVRSQEACVAGWCGQVGEGEVGGFRVES